MNITPPSLLSALRKMNRDNLRSLAEVQDEIVETGPGGTPTKRWIPRLFIPLPCRVSAPGATDQETLVASKIEAKTAIVVVFENGADVRLSDRFLITTEGGNVVMAYPVGWSPRDVEMMRKIVCEVRG